MVNIIIFTDHPDRSGSSKLIVCNRLREANAPVEHPAKKIGARSATVEPVTELIEIGLQMLGADTVKGIEYPALEVGDDDVHPGKQLRRILGACGNQGLMVKSVAQRLVGGKAVGGQNASRTI